MFAKFTQPLHEILAIRINYHYDIGDGIVHHMKTLCNQIEEIKEGVEHIGSRSMQQAEASLKKAKADFKRHNLLHKRASTLNSILFKVTDFDIRMAVRALLVPGERS